MTQPQAPGWYQDPMGRPGDARWWDGVSWTQEHVSRDAIGDDPQFAHLHQLSAPPPIGAHTETSPGSMQEYEVYVPDRPQAWQRDDSAYGPYGGHGIANPSVASESTAAQRPAKKGMLGRAAFESPTATQRAGLWWGLGAFGVIALILVILVATGAFTAKDDSEAAPGTYSSPTSDEGNQAVRVVDEPSGISYDYLGEGWHPYNQGMPIENQGVVGQYIVTQPDIPSGGQFIAQVTSGLLAESFGNPSVEQYPSVIAEVETSVRGNYYPQPNEPTNPAEGSMQIDGAPAYFRSFDLVWDVEGYDSTGERVMLILMDTGKSAPVFFYCSFPNTHAELYPLIDQVIASITVD